MRSLGRRALDRFFIRQNAYQRSVKGGRDVIAVLAAIYKCLTMCESGAISRHQGRRLATMYAEALFNAAKLSARRPPSLRRVSALRSVARRLQKTVVR